MKIIGTLPVGNITLADGRILRKLPRHTDGVYGWFGKDGLMVICTIDYGQVLPPHLHISLGYENHPPSQEDIKLVCQVFFRGISVDYTQLPQVIRKNPNVFNMRPRFGKAN